MNEATVYLLVLAGELDAARNRASQIYPGHSVVAVAKRDFREAGWKTRVRLLRAMRGAALVIFSNSLSEIREPFLLLCSGFVHRCSETALADATGRLETCTRRGLLARLPGIALSGVLDALLLVLTRPVLRALFRRAARKEIASRGDADFDIALLDPFFEPANPGGAMSYLQGTLSGWARESVTCEIFSGRPLPVDSDRVTVIPTRRRLYLFRESQSLSYNFRFAHGVWNKLRRRRSRVLYQRHGRFAFAGALLSALTRIPLVLEYQASEIWLANNWDPARFQKWLGLCEEVSIAASSRIVVLSEALRDELVARGYPENRIILNPAAVDPDRFHPRCGGDEVRARLRVASHQTLVAFAGSFSYYHGIPVLARAITALLKRREENPLFANLRFMLIGDGLLRAETEEALRPIDKFDSVIFTGLVPHASIPSYLDASDILVSPQIPNADGQPFFGSPTKLFEYMAMEKAVVASNLDQLSRVLSHGGTAWMVTPGSDTELADAIACLAANPDLRSSLGRNARAAALQRHTWRQNAVRLLSVLGPARTVAPPAASAAILPASQPCRVKADP